MVVMQHQQMCVVAAEHDERGSACEAETNNPGRQNHTLQHTWFVTVLRTSLGVRALHNSLYAWDIRQKLIRL
jgi:hypothetical protein